MVNASLLKTKKDYLEALKRFGELFNKTQHWTPEDEEYEILWLLIQHYENIHYPIPKLDPIEAIKVAMEEHNLNTTDLGKIIWYKSRASEILNRKRKLTLPMMRKLTATLQIPIELLVQEYELAN